MEQTLVILKPDCWARELMGEAISKIERKGMRIIAMKMMHVTQELAEEHYIEHKGKAFLPSLFEYVMSGPVVPMIVEGRNAVDVVRTLIGPTESTKAPPSTFRGEFSQSKRMNLVHGSDSIESAKREIALWFNKDEIMQTCETDYRYVCDYDDGEAQ